MKPNGMRPEKFITLIFVLVLFSCSNSNEHAGATGKHLKSPDLVEHAKRFSIEQHKNVYVVRIFGNRRKHDEVTGYFVLSNDTTGLRREYRYREACVIKTPCTNIAALSSIYASIFFELGALNNVTTIDNVDYIVNPEIIDRYKKGKLAEIGKSQQINIEAAVKIKPDVLFTFGMGEGEKDKDKKLVQSSIATAIVVDHLEENPLARAEWIKFFAVFVNKYARADSVFSEVEIKYNQLRQELASVKSRPTVFSEIKYSEFWYMPGGRSYVASLFGDAGADYLWKENTDFGSLPLSFEQVYARARQADYWLNLSTLNTKQELVAMEKRYADFNAFKQNQLFNNNKVVNTKGYSSYWETGMIHPERILSDLIYIFHPELHPKAEKELFYYKRLN